MPLLRYRQSAGSEDRCRASNNPGTPAIAGFLGIPNPEPLFHSSPFRLSASFSRFSQHSSLSLFLSPSLVRSQERLRFILSFCIPSPVRLAHRSKLLINRTGARSEHLTPKFRPEFSRTVTFRQTRRLSGDSPHRISVYCDSTAYDAAATCYTNAASLPESSSHPQREPRFRARFVAKVISHIPFFTAHNHGLPPPPISPALCARDPPPPTRKKNFSTLRLIVVC